MKIRKYMEYNPTTKSHVGFINYGDALDSDSETLATEAIVIMAVGVHGHWKLSLGYFLVNGITASEQEQLLVQTFQQLHESGVTALSLTLDGHQTNLSTIRKLGCSTDPDDLVHFFPHPVTGDAVCVFIDACHALKLVRNQFFALKSIEIPFTGSAQWQHLSKLNDFQKEEVLRAANRVTDRHIHFQQQKIKVCS